MSRRVQLPHYFDRPNYPQGNGRVERSLRTDEGEFYQDWLKAHPTREGVLFDMS